MNWKVRVKNPYFWVGLVGVVLTAMGVDAEMLTSWTAVKDAAVGLVSNPYAICTVALAVIGVFVDPTTKGVADSSLAMAYKKPVKH